MSTQPQRGLRRSAPQPGPRLLGVPVPPRAFGFGAGWHNRSVPPLVATRSVETVDRPRPRVPDAGRVRLGLARATAHPAGSTRPTPARAAA